MSLAAGPEPAGTSPSNAWGLKDMHGNIDEICADDYMDRLPGGVDPIGQDSPIGRNHVVRGGSWLSQADDCRSSARKGMNGKGVIAETIGFRIALVKRGN